VGIVEFVPGVSEEALRDCFVAAAPRNDKRDASFPAFFYCHCELKAWQSREGQKIKKQNDRVK